MKWRQARTLLAWASVLALPACAPGGAGWAGAEGGASGSAQRRDPYGLQAQTTAPQCQPQAAQEFLGRKATKELAEQARRLAGAETVRVIGHDDMVTKEYLASRLNLDLDEAGVVRKIYCG